MLDRVIRETENRRALERALSKELLGSERRGRGSVPASANRYAPIRKAGSLLAARFPLGKAISALQVLPDALDIQSVETFPGMSKGGTCPIVDVYDYSDVRDGLPSTTCQTGQAVGPGYSFHCNLGAGRWVKRMFSPNYNQLSWWLPTSDCAAIRAQGAPWTAGGWKYMGSALQAKSLASLPRMPNDYMSSSKAVSLPWEAVRTLKTDPNAPPGERSEIGSIRRSVAPSTQTEPSPLKVRPAEPPRSRRDRETKVTTPKWLIRAVGAVTEGLDAVSAIYDALPDSITKREAAKRGGKNPSVPDKAWLIYKNWDEIDIRSALFNLAFENLVEDRAYAFVSKNTKSPYALPGSVSGGRSLQFSQQGDADLPFGRLPTGELKAVLKAQLGLQ